jgi:hypothetical protein
LASARSWRRIARSISSTTCCGAFRPMAAINRRAIAEGVYGRPDIRRKAAADPHRSGPAPGISLSWISFRHCVPSWDVAGSPHCCISRSASRARCVRS